MSDSNQEHLSTFMDGEMDRRGSRFFVRRLAEDAGLVASWHRFHLVRNCIRQVPPVNEDLSARVARAIEAEDQPVAVGSSGWLKPIAGSAIAATVALMAIVGFNSNLMQGEETTPLQQASSDLLRTSQDEAGFVSESSGLDRPFTQAAVPVGYSETAGRRGVEPPDRARISSYVLRHNQVSGGNSGTGFVSYLPVVTSRQGTLPAGEAPDQPRLPESH